MGVGAGIAPEQQPGARGIAVAGSTVLPARRPLSSTVTPMLEKLANTAMIAAIVTTSVIPPVNQLACVVISGPRTTTASMLGTTITMASSHHHHGTARRSSNIGLTHNGGKSSGKVCWAATVPG
jgi:hypothetical protein